MLLDCLDLPDIRQKFFTASSLKDRFESIDNQNVIDFMKDVHFCRQQYYRVVQKKLHKV